MFAKDRGVKNVMAICLVLLVSRSLVREKDSLSSVLGIVPNVLLLLQSGRIAQQLEQKLYKKEKGTSFTLCDASSPLF